MKFKPLKTYSILIYMLILISCDKLEEGVVINKWYEPNRTYTQLIPMTTMAGKVPITILVPTTIYDNEDYCLTIKGKYDNKTIMQTFYVTKNYYNSYNIGDSIKLNSGYSDSDKNNKKIVK